MGWDPARDDLRQRSERRLGALVLASGEGRAGPGAADHQRPRRAGARDPARRPAVAQGRPRVAGPHRVRPTRARRRLARRHRRRPARVPRRLAGAAAGRRDRPSRPRADRSRTHPAGHRRPPPGGRAGPPRTHPSGRGQRARPFPSTTRASTPRSRCGSRTCSAPPIHPAVAKGRVPLVVHLLSPAGRPVQVTSDLPGFWAGRGARSARTWPAATPSTTGPSIRRPPRHRARGHDDRGEERRGDELEVHVPVRVCDVGGWTDTWFAGHGRVCSLAVEPGVSVTAAAAPGDGLVTVDAIDFGVTFTMGSEPPEHRLVAEAVREAGPIGPVDVRLRVTAAVPPASSLGTSASVCVGVIAALDAVRGDIRPPPALAAAAHRAEVERFGRQSGIQDQLAAAHGGANLVDIVRYPDAVARPVAVPAALWTALDERLAHIAYGSPHDSSTVHEEVIAALAHEGPSSPRLERLRQLADEAGQALAAGDLDRYGRGADGGHGGAGRPPPGVDLGRGRRADGHRPEGRCGRMEGQRSRRRRRFDQHPRSHPRRSRPAPRRGTAARPHPAPALPRPPGRTNGRGGRPHAGAAPSA